VILFIYKYFVPGTVTLISLGVYTVEQWYREGGERDTDVVVLWGKCAKFPRLGKRNL
jgi:hypothetical protein